MLLTWGNHAIDVLGVVFARSLHAGVMALRDAITVCGSQAL